MHRSAFVLLSISILVLFSQSVSAGCGGSCSTVWSVSPTTGVAPLVVGVEGRLGEWVPTLEISLGGETTSVKTFQWQDAAGSCLSLPFDVQHQFFCPGTYEIKLIDPLWPDFPAKKSITVSAPPRYHLFVFAGDTDHDVYVATHVSTSERPFSYSIVEWGDGTSETFGYIRRGLYAGTPNHSYAADGEYTATIKHQYMGQYCSWEQIETITVKIPNVSLATNPSTWGYVKSMYR